MEKKRNYKELMRQKLVLLKDEHQQIFTQSNQADQ
jgi:hypothetical protein